MDEENRIYDDFTGFTFKNVHTSDLGILHVSDGSRYTETLTPDFQDVTAKMPGSDETLYWDSFYNSKSWSLSFAYDGVTESQLRQMRQAFNAKATGDLIFDEMPYKAYKVKVQTPVELKYICFEEDGKRVYKGEGTVQFISYVPYARSVKKYLNEYTCDNKTEWAEASGMLEAQGAYDGTVASNIKLYNAGDVPTDLRIYVPLGNDGQADRCALSRVVLKNGNNIIGEMNFSTMYRVKDAETRICINTRTNLIEGVTNNGNSTGALYNKYLVSGDFFKLPVTLTGDDMHILFYNSSGELINASKVDYEYLYY